MKKNILFILLLSLGFYLSAEEISNVSIPSNKSSIYLEFDNAQLTIGSQGVVIGDMIFSGTDSSSLNTLDNRRIAKNFLTEKGYTVTQKLENADMILYGGCESSDIRSVVTLVLVDSETEEEYFVVTGSYGMGMDLKGDIKGALKRALKNIPNR